MSPRSTASERLMPGEQIDDFIVWERLHVGAQGMVYRVTGPERGFPLLMKVPRFQSGEPAIGTGEARIAEGTCAYQAIIPKAVDWRAYEASYVWESDPPAGRYR